MQNSGFAEGFLWGAATAAHQIEGNNLNNDWWKLEHDAARYGVQFSGDADDSYHRYEEDMRLLADSGLNSYRFSIEWARIEPSRGKFSRAELARYRSPRVLGHRSVRAHSERIAESVALACPRRRCG